MSQFVGLPMALIPSAILLALTFNIRLALLSKRYELCCEKAEDKKDCKRQFDEKMRWLGLAIIFQYVAVLFFVLATFLLLFSSYAPFFSYVSVLAVILGTISCFVGVVDALIEVSRQKTCH